MNTQKQIFLIVVFVFALAGGCAAYATYDLPHRFELQSDYQYEGRVERGALLYANNCRTCHGIKGEGFVGLPLDGSGKDFANQDPLVLAANQAYLRRTIQCGRAATVMPAWLKENGGALSRIQIEHLIELITSPHNTVDEEGNPTSKGWNEAVEFAHNLNEEASALVGGDTLGQIAKDHNIGPNALLELNKQNGRLEMQKDQPETIDGLLKRGSKIELPPTKQDPDGHLYQIRQDNETLAKISDSQSVGAIILADLNDIPYKMSYKTGILQLYKDQDHKEPVPGLLPGSTLKLPAGATYNVVSGDTISSVAALHGIAASVLQQNNEELLGGKLSSFEIPFERTIPLPNGTVYIAKAGDTLGSIALTHEKLAPDIAASSGMSETDTITAGMQVKLPDDTSYVIQSGDTFESISKSHGISVADLQKAAGIDAEPTAKLPTLITLELPKIDALNVRGQNLTEVAKGYGGITASDMAERNNIDVNERLYIGQSLHLPENTYGTTPPDALNPGTACVEHAVTTDAWAKIMGTEFTPTKPDNASKEVQIEANSNDWTVVADGAKSAPNQGTVKIPTGTVVKFVNNAGLHTIDVNKQKQGDDFAQGQTREVTFKDAGEFTITCEYHPAMLAWVYVE